MKQNTCNWSELFVLLLDSKRKKKERIRTENEAEQDLREKMDEENM